MENKKSLAIEDADVMKLTISDIYDDADTVISDRRKKSLSLKYFKDGYSITVEIKKNDDMMDKIEAREDIPELDREVLQRLASGQKQVEVAERLKISQAKVSGIKKTYAGLIATIAGVASAAEAVSFLAKDDKKR